MVRRRPCASREEAPVEDLVTARDNYGSKATARVPTPRPLHPRLYYDYEANSLTDAYRSLQEAIK
jgi:hypothetical protein